MDKVLWLTKKYISLFILFFTITGCSNLPIANQISHHNPLYTEHQARLKLISSNAYGNTNLIFIPGGPGIDAEYFSSFAARLDIKGNIWLLDLPDNGTNRHNNVDFSKWPDYIVEAVKTMDNVVVAGHSHGGMLILSEPELDKHVKALVLLNTTPISHLNFSATEKEKYNLPDIGEALSSYMKNPSDLAVLNLAIAASDYYFAKEFKEQGINYFKQAHYNHHSLDWVIKNNFWGNYNSKYIPTVPCLIIGAEFDHITPFYSFTSDERFKRPNINMVYIKNAGHFPWIEQPEETKETIEVFINSLN